MKQTYDLEKLNRLEYFTLDTLRNFVSLNGTSLYKFVMRKVKNGEFIYIRKGLYVTVKYFEDNNKEVFLEKIANKLKMPSYISMEYMLSKYSVLSENVFTITSITTKKTNVYENSLGRFYYRNIKDNLFEGFVLENKVYRATKAKALFDFLYFKTRNTNLKEYRLNLDEFTKADIQEFKKYILKQPNMYNLYEEMKTYVY